jgi:hypothetical protein
MSSIEKMKASTQAYGPQPFNQLEQGMQTACFFAGDVYATPSVQFIIYTSLTQHSYRGS